MQLRNILFQRIFSQVAASTAGSKIEQLTMKTRQARCLAPGTTLSC